MNSLNSATVSPPLVSGYAKIFLKSKSKVLEILLNLLLSLIENYSTETSFLLLYVIKYRAMS